MDLLAGSAERISAVSVARARSHGKKLRAWFFVIFRALSPVSIGLFADLAEIAGRSDIATGMKMPRKSAY